MELNATGYHKEMFCFHMEPTSLPFLLCSLCSHRNFTAWLNSNKVKYYHQDINFTGTTGRMVKVGFYWPLQPALTVVQISGEAEIVAAKVYNGKQEIIFGSAYRPPNSNIQVYMDNLNQSIMDICLTNPSTAVWIGGDMNLPDINWETEQIASHQYRLDQ